MMVKILKTEKFPPEFLSLNAGEKVPKKPKLSGRPNTAKHVPKESL